MAQVNVNPDEMRKFAQQLSQFTKELRQGMSKTQGSYRALGETWQDQEEKKFAEDFNETMRVLGLFVDLSDKHVPFLIRKAQKADDFLNQR